MPHVAFYITGHGFGHATRMAAVASTLARQKPGVEISLITTVPEWLFRINLPHEFRLRPRALDIGVIQADPIHLDPEATLEAYARLLKVQHTAVQEEAEILRRDGVDLVVADIPPAAFLVASSLQENLPNRSISISRTTMSRFVALSTCGENPMWQPSRRCTTNFERNSTIKTSGS